MIGMVPVVVDASNDGAAIAGGVNERLRILGGFASVGSSFIDNAITYRWW